MRSGKYHILRAGVVRSATLAVALQLAGVCCASAQAQTQTAPPPSTIWDHNGSVMYLVANGPSREFYYQKPRPGMLDAGARPGSLLFRGQVNDGLFLGTAYVFNPHCGPIPFEAKGAILDDDERIVLTGQAPRVGRNCRAYESYSSNLEFRRLKPPEAAQSQEPLAAPHPPAGGAVKTEVSPRKANELASEPAAQPAVKNEAPLAPKNSSAAAANPHTPSIPTAPASMTNETQGAMDLNKIKWGAAFVVMIVWLLLVLFGRTLIKKG